MEKLVQFLWARLDEEQAEAEAASPGPWRASAESNEVLTGDETKIAIGFALSGQQLRATTTHIARYNPARALAEINVKRQVIGRINSHAADAFADLSTEEQWARSMPALRDSTRGLELRPNNWREFRFEHRLSMQDLTRDDYLERIRAVLGLVEES